MSGVELKNVVKRFGDVVVVKELNLAIAEGEFLVLLGESGCGKSTTLRMIAGLEEVTAGRISIGGRDVTDTHPMDRDIAMVFQNYALYPHMDVAKNMSFSLRISGVSQDVIAQRVAKAAKILNIEHILKRKPKELSGGQRQRVAIGRAIVREPKVFLFDEPLSNLDAKLRGHMRAELAVLHERLGKTTIYVTHDQVEAMTLATRIVVFDKGSIQQVGTPAEVFNNPANLFVAGFIGTPSMNLFEVTASVGEGNLRFVGNGIDWGSPAWMSQVPVQDGQALTLGLRPQSISVGSQMDNRFSLRTDVVEYLGTESQVVGSMPINELRRVSAMVPKDARAMLHQSVDFSFDPNALHVFDTASGASLRPTTHDTH